MHASYVRMRNFEAGQSGGHDPSVIITFMSPDVRLYAAQLNHTSNTVNVNPVGRTGFLPLYHIHRLIPYPSLSCGLLGWLAGSLPCRR